MPCNVEFLEDIAGWMIRMYRWQYLGKQSQPGQEGEWVLRQAPRTFPLLGCATALKSHSELPDVRSKLKTERKHVTVMAGNKLIKMDYV